MAFLGLTEVSAQGWDHRTCGTVVAPNPNADVAMWTARGNPMMVGFDLS
jgi:hypothetical protein